MARADVDRDQRIRMALVDAAKQIASEAIAKDPGNRAQYEARLKSYRSMTKGG